MKNHRLKWIWAVFSLPFLLGFVPVPFQAGGQTQVNSTSDFDACTISNSTFQHGEELTYKVYYNLNFLWVAAGEVVFCVNEVGDQFHFSVEGKTFKSYEWFFKVRDYYDTYVEKSTLLPTLSIRDVREGGYTLYDKVDFNQAQQTAFSTRGRSKDNIKKQKEYQVDPCMHDLLSLIYYTRNMQFDQMNTGEKVPVKIFIDEETWPLQMTYNGRVAKKSIKGLGKFKTLEFSPEVIEGEYFKDGTGMRIWVSDDGNKIPLLIQSPIAVGSIKAVLKSYKGLRHPLSSEIED